jgi:mediator of replication checkpoint protein 1
MPVNKEYSIVADSTAHISSPPTTTPAVKRARFTYGRPKLDTPVHDSDTFIFQAANSSSSHDSVYRTGPLDLDEEIPPSSDPARVLSDAELSDDEDDGNSRKDALSKHEWEWRKKLRALDSEEDVDVEMPAIPAEVDASESREPSNDDALFPQRPIHSTFDHIPTSPAHHGTTNLADHIFGGSLSTLTASSLSSNAFDKSPPLSPEIAPSRRRLSKPKRIVQDSDSETENIANKSSPTNTSPAFPHSIGTPPTNSSPTPPTSDDDMPARLPKNMSKGRGKATAKARPDVEPLRFSEEPAATVVKRTKDKHNKKSKIKVRPAHRGFG